MTSNLYQELGVSTDAPQDQIRKAYKKRALQTHPDRLPPGATPQQKADADEKFRRVNNAYEVLSDPNKRTEYDRHGVWPPPEEQDDLFTSRMPGGSRAGFSRTHQHSRSRTFPDPFAFHQSAFGGFQFTDPYTLFDSLFDNALHAHSRPRHAASYPQMGHNPREHLQRMQAEIESFMDDIDRDPFASMGGGFPRMMMSNPLLQMPPIVPIAPLPPSGRDRHAHGRQWVSDSYVTSTVNGITQTIHKRVDSEGNEHITRTLPDGQKVRTINGIEQPSPTGYLSYNNYDYEYGTSSMPSMPSNHSPPPSYHEHTPPMDTSGYRRTRRSSDKYAYTSQPIPNPDVPRSHEDRHHHSSKKRWWQ